MEEKMQRKKAMRVIGPIIVSIVILISGYAIAGTGKQANIPYGVSNGVPLAINSLAVADVDSKGKAYVITSAMKDIGDDDLEFKIAARYIKNALSQKGYVQVDSKEKADLNIRLAYGFGEPQITTSTHTTPGYAYPVGWWWCFVPPKARTEQSTFYTTSIVLVAYDLKAPGKLPQIWKTTLSYESQWEMVPDNSKVLDLIPNMIAPAVLYLGTNKGRVETFLYSGKCQAVIDIEKE